MPHTIVRYITNNYVKITMQTVCYRGIEMYIVNACMHLVVQYI